MSLASILSDDFDSAIRSRGKVYYWQSRVRIRTGSSKEVHALVRGSRTYEVNLDWQDGELSLDCDCDYFDSAGPCKHLWATILAADAKGYLAEARNSPGLFADYGDPTMMALDEDEELDEAGEPNILTSRSLQVVSPQQAPKTPAWMTDLTRIASRATWVAGPDPWPAKREIVYMVDLSASRIAGNLVLGLGSHDRKLDGSWSTVSPLAMKRQQLSLLLSPDREILAALAGGTEHMSWGSDTHSAIAPSRQLIYPLAAGVLPIIVRTGRCYLGSGFRLDGSPPLTWDEGEPWKFRLSMRRGKRDRWVVAGQFARGEEVMDASAPDLVLPGGFLFAAGRAAPLAPDAAIHWLTHFRDDGVIEAPEPDGEALLAALLNAPGAPEVDVPEELGFEYVQLSPRPGLRIRAPKNSQPGAKLSGDLSFDYDGRVVPAGDPSRGHFDASTRRFLRRDPEAEGAARRFLEEAGLKFQRWSYSNVPRLGDRALQAAAGSAHPGGRPVGTSKPTARSSAARARSASAFRAAWIGSNCTATWNTATLSAKLPALLEAVRRGENMVRLDDGTYGVLPEEWLKRIGVLAGMGEAQDGHMRFRRSQAGLLDALLAAQPEATCDETFARMRQEMRAFSGIEAAVQPAGFVGQLRDYQREGLGWMDFLRRFSFGGCLADDMGVGKTAQVLALLETRREMRAAGEPVGPSLVVVPQSLVFNWKQESHASRPNCACSITPAWIVTGPISGSTTWW